MKKILSIVFILRFTNLAFGQMNIVDSIVHQTYQRKFTVHTPPGYNNNAPLPVLLMLHGGGGTMVNSQNFTNLNNVSNANGFLAAYPEGYGIVPTGGFSWADGRGTSADLAGIDDLGFIDKLLDSLLANYSIDANKIYICGFSNGGFMTQRFACQQNQRFAAMASLGSIMDTSLFANCNPQRAIPMMFVLGTDDPFVPFNGGTMQGSGLTTEIVSGDTLVNFWRINNNCIQSSPPLDLPDIVQSDSSTVTLFNYSICSCNSDVKFYRINGGGHTWPGVEIPLYEVIAGQTNEDIQASVEMWNFFNAHSLCNSGVGVTENEKINSTTFYPNPTSDILFINQVNNNFIQYQITNSTGKLLLQDSFIDNGINISNLTNGFYFIRFTNDKNETAYYKFVKQ